MWRHSDLILRLLFVSCVALVAVPFIAANTDDSGVDAAHPAQVINGADPRFFDFDFGFISKDCGPKTGCDCASTNTDCSAEVRPPFIMISFAKVEARRNSRMSCLHVIMKKSDGPTCPRPC